VWCGDLVEDTKKEMFIKKNCSGAVGGGVSSVPPLTPAEQEGEDMRTLV
jgi:hypothetical protein